MSNIFISVTGFCSPSTSSLTKYMSLEHPPDISIYFLIPSYPSSPPPPSPHVRRRWRWCMPAVRTRWYERPRWLGFWRSHHLFSSFSSDISHHLFSFSSLPLILSSLPSHHLFSSFSSYFSHHIISSFSFSYFLTSFSSYLIAFPWIPFLLRLAPQYPSTLITFPSPVASPSIFCLQKTQWQPAPQWQRVVSIELDR